MWLNFIGLPGLGEFLQHVDDKGLSRFWYVSVDSVDGVLDAERL